MSPANWPVSRDEIAIVARQIRPYVRRTPVLEVSGADVGVSFNSIAFKLEVLQHSGSFKARGAFTNMLTRHVPQAGVVAASGGNHGAAVAYAARILGWPATIFVPSVASPAKLARIQSYGASLKIAGDRYADALAASEEWALRSGALRIHAYDATETIVGQATLGMELQEQCPDLDTLLVAVGGGGLIAGIASWYGGSIKLVGVEPEAAPTLTRALEAGKPVDAPAGGIAADSLAPKRVGELVFPIVRRYIDKVLLVSDEEIVTAQQRLWDSLRIVTEPGGAAAFAALISERHEFKPEERVGVVLCGANTEAVRFQ
jgi:threonine dehydratase